MAEALTAGGKVNTLTNNILIPLPDHDFDPTECAIPWEICSLRGWKVTFSTEHGNVAQADPHLLKGPIFGPLGAGAKALAAYRRMTQDIAYQHPTPYAEINVDRHLALLLPGGHASGVRQYLESPVLQSKVLQFWQQKKLIGAICHGVLVLARTINPETKRSILYGCKVTATPRTLDRFGYLSSRLLRRFYLPYYEEVLLCLQDPKDFSNGSNTFTPYVVCDGNLLTARYWHDAELFANRFADELQQRMRGESKPI